MRNTATASAHMGTVRPKQATIDIRLNERNTLGMTTLDRITGDATHVRVSREEAIALRDLLTHAIRNMA